jgi:hypothetical protein
MIAATQSTSGILLKVGKPHHIVDMYEKEYVYFNTLSSFRAKERDASGRNDPREANLTNRQANYLEITVPDGPTIKLHEISSQFNAQFIESPSVVRYNICSLYLLRLDERLGFEPLDDKMLLMGDLTLVIHDPKLFLEVLDCSLRVEGLEFSRRPVRYYDPMIFDGSLGVHDKDKIFDYQCEYRIILDTPGQTGIKINVPGLLKKRNNIMHCHCRLHPNL